MANPNGSHKGRIGMTATTSTATMEMFMITMMTMIIILVSQDPDTRLRHCVRRKDMQLAPTTKYNTESEA